MRKIRILEHISLDGVIQGPGGPHEDEDGAFEHGGWSVPFADAVARDAIVTAHRDPFDLLLGRRTYDIWSGYWPKVRTGPFAASFNAATKHIATHRPESLSWGPVESLGADVVAGIRRIKSQPGPDLIVWGSSTLTPVLLTSGLVDEVVLITYPVVLGAGKRFFSASAPPCELGLVGTKTGTTGVIVSTYRPVGPLRTGSFPEPPV